MDETKISADRLEVLAKIKEYEKAGRFDEDVENDPPAPELLPDKVDYLCKKLSLDFNGASEVLIDVEDYYEYVTLRRKILDYTPIY